MSKVDWTTLTKAALANFILGHVEHVGCWSCEDDLKEKEYEETEYRNMIKGWVTSADTAGDKSKLVRTVEIVIRKTEKKLKEAKERERVNLKQVCDDLRKHTMNANDLSNLKKN
jgi:hypothetical protein